MRKVYYKHGVWQVTDEFVKARGRSIQLSTLESVDLSRRLFLMALGLGVAIAGFGLAWADLLTGMEIAVSVAAGLALLVLAWNIATLTIYSKLTGHKGWAVTGWAWQLHRMRDAIELALEDRAMTRRSGKNRGGAVTEEEEDDAGDE